MDSRRAAAAYASNRPEISQRSARTKLARKMLKMPHHFPGRWQHFSRTVVAGVRVLLHNVCYSEQALLALDRNYLSLRRWLLRRMDHSAHDGMVSGHKGALCARNK